MNNHGLGTIIHAVGHGVLKEILDSAYNRWRFCGAEKKAFRKEINEVKHRIFRVADLFCRNTKRLRKAVNQVFSVRFAHQWARRLEGLTPVVANWGQWKIVDQQWLTEIVVTAFERDQLSVRDAQSICRHLGKVPNLSLTERAIAEGWYDNLDEE